MYIFRRNCRALLSNFKKDGGFIFNKQSTHNDLYLWFSYVVLIVYPCKYIRVIFPSSVGKVREVMIDSIKDNKAQHSNGNSVVDDALR